MGQGRRDVNQTQKAISSYDAFSDFFGSSTKVVPVDEEAKDSPDQGFGEERLFQDLISQLLMTYPEQLGVARDQQQHHHHHEDFNFLTGNHLNSDDRLNHDPEQNSSMHEDEQQQVQEAYAQGETNSFIQQQHLDEADASAVFPRYPTGISKELTFREGDEDLLEDHEAQIDEIGLEVEEELVAAEHIEEEKQRFSRIVVPPNSLSYIEEMSHEDDANSQDPYLKQETSYSVALQRSSSLKGSSSQVQRQFSAAAAPHRQSMDHQASSSEEHDLSHHKQQPTRSENILFSPNSGLNINSAAVQTSDHHQHNDQPVTDSDIDSVQYPE